MPQQYAIVSRRHLVANHTIFLQQFSVYPQSYPSILFPSTVRSAPHPRHEFSSRRLARVHSKSPSIRQLLAKLVVHSLDDGFRVRGDECVESRLGGELLPIFPDVTDDGIAERAVRSRCAVVDERDDGDETRHVGRAVRRCEIELCQHGCMELCRRQCFESCNVVLLRQGVDPDVRVRA